MPRKLNKLQESAKQEVVLKEIELWSGSRPEALNWYHTYPIAALGGLTAQELVTQGRTHEVLEYLRHIRDGGYA
ncbi:MULTISPECIES: antitoxin Xre/MbcA/ParS toxin-binding domain-containing protein [unclassified Halomonas]|uniref:antitoxin Xre/MbcA/ParS toxin-binding domain-containing protein n=1 Tax=unclassified Halomonas TaxID=2609666 RepID=UPI00038D85E0|nr:antitoxin Xre/MbcA/ParS toxin-binding domain-containing protein [Halomonas sp. A3H3]CDG52413.1 conserved hypothetical protein [Halomonas sp. A3H3]